MRERGSTSANWNAPGQLASSYDCMKERRKMEQDQSKPGAQTPRSPLVVSLRESMKQMSPLLLLNYVVYSSPLETLERIMDDAETDHFADTRDTLLARLTELGAWLGEESDQREPGALLEMVLETPLEILERTRTEAEVRHFTEQRERLLAYLEEE